MLLKPDIFVVLVTVQSRLERTYDFRVEGSLDVPTYIPDPMHRKHADIYQPLGRDCSKSCLHCAYELAQCPCG